MTDLLQKPHDKNSVLFSLLTISNAEKAIVKKMAEAGIPSPSVYIALGYRDTHVMVYMRANKRVFISQGKRNSQSGCAVYGREDEVINEIAEFLKVKK